MREFHEAGNLMFIVVMLVKKRMEYSQEDLQQEPSDKFF